MPQGIALEELFKKSEQGVSLEELFEEKSGPGPVLRASLERARRETAAGRLRDASQPPPGLAGAGEIGRALGGGLAGLAKGVGQAAYGAAALTPPGMIGRALSGAPLVPRPGEMEMLGLTPRGTAQEVGAVAPLAAAAITAPVPTALGVGGALVGQKGAEMLGAGEDTARAAAVLSGMAAGGGAAALPSLTRALRTRFAGRLINSLVKSTGPESLPRATDINGIVANSAPDWELVPNPGQIVAREGIASTRRAGYYTSLLRRKSELGRNISNTLRAAGDEPVVDVRAAIRGPIDRARVTARDSGDEAAVAALDRLEQGLTKNLLPRLGIKEKASPLQAFEAKKAVGDVTRFKGQAEVEQLLNETRRKIYSRLRADIDAAVPAVKDSNLRYGAMESILPSFRRALAARERADFFSAENLRSIPETGIKTWTARALTADQRAARLRLMQQVLNPRSAPATLPMPPGSEQFLP